MSSALDHVRYSCGIAGEEVAQMVDALEAERDRLAAELKELRQRFDKLNQECDEYMADNKRLDAENKMLLELLTCVETNLSKGMSKSIQRLQAREIRAALKEKP